MIARACKIENVHPRDQPDEKSIMMYVAEMIKVAETRTEQASSLSETVTPEMHLFDNLMLWTTGAEQG